jgi:hypothetical protein
MSSATRGEITASSPSGGEAQRAQAPHIMGDRPRLLIIPDQRQ